ncbi:hypothetical protein SAMN02910264_01449 [Ruminococcaceae bacterium YAD3003]|nr:hypothetical protein SAMN02910264_01449 [Ruminococcaceae bacterium YAD3003]
MNRPESTERSKVNKSNVSKYIFVGALVLLFAVCTELFRRMTVSFPGLIGTYYSDINVRLDMGGDQYSIFLIPEFLFVEKFGLNFGAVLIGLYLSLFVVGTVAIVYLLLKIICPDTSFGILAAFSLICIFAIPIFIPVISERILSPYAGSIWHNESYLGMRFMAMLVLLFFYQTNDKYMLKFNLKNFIVESVLFLFVNWIKPNFIIAFGPAMLIMMIIDIVKAKGCHFFNWMMYGIPVIIGSLILPYQYLILFPGNGSGSGDAGSVTLVLGDFFFYQKKPFLNLVFVLAFPVFMFIIHRKEFIKSRFHLVCSLGWIFSFLEFFFLSETGIRRGHENFYWGVRFFTFLIFVLSIGYFINDIRTYQTNKKNKAENKADKKKGGIDIFFIENIFVILHLFSGTVYFALVVLGARASEL